MKRRESISLSQTLKRVTFEGIEERFSQKYMHRDLSEIVVYLAVFGYILIFSYFTILKYEVFHAYAWDLGIFNQSFWTTAHAGKLFFSTVEQYIIPSGVFFGTHFSPVLFFVLPFYYIASMPQTLLLFQSLILALGAVPLYFFAKNALNNRVIAVVFALAYLLYPPLQGVNWFDFHAQAFLPLFFFSAFYFLFKEKWPHYFLFVVLSLTVAENVPITVVFIGLYCFWRFRKDILKAVKTRMFAEPKLIAPILTIALALVWFVLAGWVQQLYPVNHDFTQLFKAANNWSTLIVGDPNPKNTVVGDPLQLPLYLVKGLGNEYTLRALLYDFPLKLLYIVLLFGPLLFLSIRSSITAISLAWLFPAIFSNYSPYYTIGGHFPAYPLAFIFLAAVEALRPKPQSQVPHPFLRRLQRLYQPLSRRFSPPTCKRLKTLRILRLPSLKTSAKLLLVCSVLFALIVSPISPVMNYMNNVFTFADYYPPSITTHDQVTQKIAALVPENASILTVSNIFPHFSSRVNAYVYPLDSAINWAINQNTPDPTDLESAPDPKPLIDLKNYSDDLFTKSDYIMTDSQKAPYFTDLITGQNISGKVILFLSNCQFSKEEHGFNWTAQTSDSGTALSAWFGLYAYDKEEDVCLFERNYQGQAAVVQP